MGPSPLKRAKTSVSPFPRDRLSDAELVHAIAQGQAQAVGVVWDRYSALVRSVLRAGFGIDAAIEDLLQEVFVAFVRRAGALRSGEALRPYLVAIARRLILVELRRRRVRRWVTLAPDDQVPEGRVAADDVEGAEALRALYRVLDRMPPRRRLAFVLRHVQGFEVTESARILEVSESTIKREVARARREILERARRDEPALSAYVHPLERDDHA